MSVLNKLRDTMRLIIDGHDPVKHLQDLGYSMERAKALAKTKGIESARSLSDKQQSGPGKQGLR